MAVSHRLKIFEFVMTAVTIHGQVGGSLAGLFDIRRQCDSGSSPRRKIKGLTAMGRMSAYVLIGLPFVVGTAIYAINRQVHGAALYTSTGHKLILTSSS